MMNTRILATAVASLVLVLGLLTATALSADRVSSATVPDTELDILGLELGPLDSAARADEDRGLTVDETAARHAVERRIGVEPGEPEVLHVMARVTPDAPRQAVWLLLYKGGKGLEDLIPWGPVGEEFGNGDGPPTYTVNYSGFLIDHKSGEVLRMFLGGRQ